MEVEAIMGWGQYGREWNNGWEDSTGVTSMGGNVRQGRLMGEETVWVRSTTRERECMGRGGVLGNGREDGRG